MPSKTELEAKIASKKLREMILELDLKTRRKVLRNAAKPMVESARSNAPVGERVHYRYGSSGKLASGIRAPKGKGKKIAKYVPGNLRNSIRVLTFRRDRSAVYVGPKIAKRFSGFKTYGTNKTTVDAYYAHMVEFGTRNYVGRAYMRKAYGQTRGKVIREVEANLRSIMKRYEAKNRV